MHVHVCILILSYVSGNTQHLNVRLKVHLTYGGNGNKSQCIGHLKEKGSSTRPDTHSPSPTPVGASLILDKKFFLPTITLALSDPYPIVIPQNVSSTEIDISKVNLKIL